MRRLKYGLLGFVLGLMFASSFVAGLLFLVLLVAGMNPVLLP